MFKKKINIVLFILVLSVWGAILYNIASRYFINNENQSFTASSNYNSKIRITQKDSFELVNPKRDPFLNVEHIEKKPVVTVKSKKIGDYIKEKKLPSNNKAPVIHYFGYITTESNQSTALLKIDNKKVKLVLNQEHDGVKLMKMYRDSIVIAFNKEHKVIIKQK